MTKTRDRTIASKTGPDPVDLHVGRRLRLRRTLMGMTQQQLASAVGVTFQQVQKYEMGTNRISASRLFDIARATGVDIMFFFEDADADLSSEGRPNALPRIPVPADMLARSETLELIRLYWSLGTTSRKTVLDLVQAIAPPEPDVA